MSTPNTLQSSANVSESAPVDSSTVPTGREPRDVPAQVRDVISGTIHYSTRIVEDVVKPSIKTFLETCDTNPQVAAIVATPALLAFLLAIAFLVISTLVLVLWSLLTISVGVAFVVLGGLISLVFKLLVVLMATIPLAGIATGLLVGANATSQFIIKKLPGGGMGGMTRMVKELDWAQIMEGGTTVGKTAAQYARDDLLTVGLAFHSAIHTAMTALHHTVDTQSTPNTQRSNLTEETVEETVEEILQPTAVSAPTKDERIEPIDISNLSNQPESPSRNLKQRVPFSVKTGDDEADDRR